jgi:hypothetical protein
MNELVSASQDQAPSRLFTSGASVDTCTRAMLRAGAAHVDVLVFARVVAPVRITI